MKRTADDGVKWSTLHRAQQREINVELDGKERKHSDTVDDE